MKLTGIKKNKTIVWLVLTVFAGMLISCKLFASTDVAEHSSTGNAENRGDSSSNANVRTASATPYPAANCPAESFRIFDLTGEKYKTYEGCTLTFYGKLLSVEEKTAALVDDSERTELERDDYSLKARALTCSGDFSDNTNYQVGQKLEEIKRLKQFGRLPSVTYKATVKTVDGYTSLTDCSLVSFRK